MSRKLDSRRIDVIAERQFPTRYEKEYIPSVLATPDEAPTISRPAIRTAAKLERRVHALSVSELKCIVLALYCPTLFDLHENFAFPNTPGPHWLAGHPVAAGLPLPVTQGTLTHAAANGVLSLHPSSREKDPAYYLGDLLLFLLDDLGPYVVEWDIKPRDGLHGKPFPGNPVKAESPRAKAKANAREVVLDACRAELQHRCVQVSAEDLPETLIENLHRLLGWHHRRIDRPHEQVMDLVEDLRRVQRSGVAAYTLLPKWQALGWPREDFLKVFHQAIWNRELRVDLFRTVLVDRPLRSEERDVMDVFKNLFAR